MKKHYYSDEIKEIFPSYNEEIQIKEGSSFLCKVLWHKRVVYHAQIKKESEQETKYYEAYVCTRCHNTIGKLVNVSKKVSTNEQHR